MWQKLSLRGRINLLLALGLTLGLAINIARLVVEAGPRVRAEDQSVIRLAREFVETIVPGLNEAPDPDAPLKALSQTMANIEAGHYGSRVEPGGAPELAALCAKLNHLAGVLGEAIEDKRRLAERTVSLQDLERKEIARELHDEFGPYLFTLRAHAGALMRLSEDGRAPGADALRQAG